MPEHLPPNRGHKHFPTTHWSLVGRAAGRADASGGKVALGELLRVYLPALRAHLLGPMGVPRDRAEDLLQGFLADKVLEQNMIAAADPGRGKFRTFLLTALERFVIDAHRRESAAKRAPRGKVLDVEEFGHRAAKGHNPTHAFDRAWAGEVLNEVTRRLRAECQQTDRAHLWGIFEQRMLQPIIDGAEPPSHEELARKYDLPSAAHSANALTSAKRLFTRTFRAVVAEYAADKNEVDSEIRELWEIFSRPAA
jgi:DNA-directed RNA polymerase specialized sigma24 family protein